MAGILANAASSPTMASGDTAADKAWAGFVTGEEVALSTVPTGTSHVWALARPAGSAARVDINDPETAAPRFSPDVAGLYTITCVVDGTTTYVLRITVTRVALVSVADAHRLSPILDAQVPAPALGGTIFYSATQDALAMKLPDDSVHTIDTTLVTP